MDIAGIDMNQTNIHMRLYKSILLIGAGLSVISIIGNLISGFSLWINIKWIALFIIAALAFLFSNKEKNQNHRMFGVFVFLIYVFLPFAFFDSGGSENNTIGYTFLLLITVTYLFYGWKRVFLVSSLIAAFIILHILEYFIPEIVSNHSPQSQFIDRIIQIPLLIFVSFFVILQFAKEYELVNKKLKIMAEYDELTTLHNKRVFNKSVKETFVNKRDAYLAFLDLNNFKKVNDSCGHFIGDCVLRGLADILKNSFDTNKHIVSRWGGDEFAIVFYGEKEELIEKLDYITEKFNNYVTEYESSAGVSTSVVYMGDYNSLSEILNIADKQLYKKKRNVKS